MREKTKVLGATVEANNTHLENIRANNDAISQEAAEAERGLALSETNLALASMKGDTAGAIAKKQEAENKYLLEQLKSTDIMVKTAEENIKKQKEFLAGMKEAEKIAEKAVAEAGDNKEAKEAAEAQLIQARVGKAAAVAAVNELESGIDAQRSKAAGIAEKMSDVSAKIGEALDAFEGNLTGRSIAAELDLSDALGEAAEFSDDFASITKKAFEISKKAAMADAKARIAAIESAAKTQTGIVQEQVDAGALTKEEGDIKLRTVAADTQARKAREETKYKERVVASAEKEANLARESISIREGVIDAEMSYLETVGGSLDAFAQLQNQSLSVEREKLEVAKENLRRLEEGKIKGLKLRNAEADVIKQGFELRKKEFGVQKDMFDKLIGGVFGQIRSETGARRQRFNDMRKSGNDGRIKLPNGLLVGAGAGGTQTIDQRRNDRMLGGDGVRGANLNGAGGVADQSPGKTKEEELFGEAKANRAENAKAAAAVANMDKNSNTVGSLYVHDDGLHHRMDSLLSMVGTIISELKGIEKAASTPAEIKDAGATSDKVGALVNSIDATGKKVDKAAVAMKVVAAGVAVQGNKPEGESAGVAKAQVDAAEESKKASKEAIKAAVITAKGGATMSTGMAMGWSAIATTTKESEKQKLKEMEASLAKMLTESSGNRGYSPAAKKMAKEISSMKRAVIKAEEKKKEEIKLADMEKAFASSVKDSLSGGTLAKENAEATLKDDMKALMAQRNKVAGKDSGKEVKEAVDKVGDTLNGDAEKTRTEIAKAAKEQKDATEKAGAKTKAAVDNAAEAQAASVVAGATAGVQATGKAEKTFAEKLTQSRSTLSDMLKAIKEDMSGEGIDDKLNAAGGEIQKIISMEAKIRKAQNRSGIAGSEAGIKDIDRIWAGGMPKELQELGKLTAERRKIKEKEAQGREAEQGEKEHTERVKRTAIATGRAVVETKKEGAGIAASAPLSAVSDRVKGSSAAESRTSSRSSNTKKDIEKAAKRGADFASKSNLASRSGSSGSRMGFGGDRTRFAGGQALKSAVGEMTGDSFKNFQGQTAKDIARAANGARSGAMGGMTASGRPAFMGGGVATAAAQMSSNDGLTMSLNAEGDRETRGEVIDRLKAEAKSKELDGKDRERFDLNAITGVVSKIVTTPFGEMKTALQGKEADAAMASMGFREATANDNREFDVRAMTGEVSEVFRGENGEITRKILEGQEANNAMAAMGFSGPPETTTGGESMAFGTSVTANEQVKSGQEAVVPPGVQAKAEPNGAVSSLSTATNDELASKQQGFASTTESRAFQNKPELAVGGGSGGSGMSELPVMKVEGTMKVEFNQGIFNSAIATVVGRVINSPEIYKSLQAAGFVNSNS